MDRPRRGVAGIGGGAPKNRPRSDTYLNQSGQVGQVGQTDRRSLQEKPIRESIARPTSGRAPGPSGPTPAAATAKRTAAAAPTTSITIRHPPSTSPQPAPPKATNSIRPSTIRAGAATTATTTTPTSTTSIVCDYCGEIGHHASIHDPDDEPDEEWWTALWWADTYNADTWWAGRWGDCPICTADEEIAPAADDDQIAPVDLGDWIGELSRASSCECGGDGRMALDRCPECRGWSRMGLDDPSPCGRCDSQGYVAADPIVVEARKSLRDGGGT